MNTRGIPVGAVDIVIRDVDGAEEIRAVEALQKEVWGLPDLDVVPLTQLVAAKAAGGILLGAYDGKTLAGFVYGFAGYEDGRSTHHSHMLAVRPEYHRLKLGYRLKLAQRERVMAQGIERITWTFDPLQSLNAHLNFNKLGVVSDQYFVNFYGEDASSHLHRNGTDRLWVIWRLNSRHVLARLDANGSEPDLKDVRGIVEVSENNAPRYTGLPAALLPLQAVIEIPGDINEIGKNTPEIAADWREATRQAFSEGFSRGYIAEGFYRGLGGEQTVGRYLLTLKEKGD
jgi:predicted GNAT superfamily acetyltransferase